MTRRKPPPPAPVTLTRLPRFECTLDRPVDLFVGHTRCKLSLGLPTQANALPSESTSPLRKPRSWPLRDRGESAAEEGWSGRSPSASLRIVSALLVTPV